MVLMVFVYRTQAADTPRIGPTSSLEMSYFCALCEPVTASGYEKYLTEKFPKMDFFRLNPVKIYWGSYKNAKSSLLLHPVPKGEGKTQVLVVFRGENNLGPGDWLKSYIPIQKDKRSPKYYLLDGEGVVSGGELKRFLEKYSKVMQKKFPLDREHDKE